MATLRSNYTQEAANGAYSTSTTTAFTIPVLGGSDTQEFNDVSWVSVGQVVYFSDGTSWGLFTVTAVDHKADTVTLKNTWNEINGTVINVGGRLSPAGRPGGQGIQGVQGVQGVQGNAGISAYEVAVNKGFVGTEAQWLASLVGAQGIQGIQGIQGVAGNDGSNGSNGLSAYEIAVNAGFTGTEQEWLVHIAGTDGKDGAPGQDGNDGLSAYEVAVNAGFVGTEQQWLNSLVGGQGIQGVPGSDGSDGSDGKSAYQVAVDNGFIGTEQAWIDTLRGPQGEKGDPGHDGAVGASGLSAYQVGINNGFVGTQQEWLNSLVGPQGIQGIQGDNAYTVAVNNGYTGTEAQWLDSLRAKYKETAIHIPLSPYGVNAYAYTNQSLLGRYFPYDLIVSSVSLTLDTAPTGSAVIVDIKQNGVSVFSGLLTVADGQTGSSTYTFANSLTLFSAGDLITFDVTQVGATTPGKYPVLTIEGKRGDVQSVVVPLLPLGVNATLESDLALLGRSFPFDFRIDNIILTLDTAPTGSAFIVDIKLNAVSIFSTLLSVDDGENASTTATTAYALSTTPTTITKGDLVTFSITQIGATTPGKYPVVTMIGREI